MNQPHSFDNTKLSCPTRVLVTAIGTMNCTTIISELKRAEENFYIIGADINQRQCVANSNEVDEYYQFPSVLPDREGYVRYVLHFCVQNHIQALFCVVDEEVEAVVKHKSDFEAIGVLVCLANKDAIITCHNKDLFAAWSESIIPNSCIKRYEHPTDIADTDFPVFIKPTEGRASIGCKIVRTRTEMNDYINDWPHYLCQQYVQGDIVAVDIVRNAKTGQFQIAQRLELLRNSNGCGIAVKIVDIPELRSLCSTIAQGLNLDGIVNAEFFLTKNGAKIIEINPRLPAGIAYSCMAGLDVVLNALRIARGEACKFSPIKVGAHYAKRYETYETK